MLTVAPWMLAQAAPTDGAAPPPPAAAPAPASPAVDATGAAAPAGPDASGAQTLQPPTTGPGAAAPAANSGGPGFGMMMIILVVMGAFLLMSTMGQRKERKKRDAMLKALGKGDKVQTVGGMIGTVVEVRDQEVVLKVDDQSGTRLKFVRSAIQGVVEEKAE